MQNGIVHMSGGGGYPPGGGGPPGGGWGPPPGAPPGGGGYGPPPGAPPGGYGPPGGGPPPGSPPGGWGPPGGKPPGVPGGPPPGYGPPGGPPPGGPGGPPVNPPPGGPGGPPPGYGPPGAPPGGGLPPGYVPPGTPPPGYGPPGGPPGGGGYGPPGGGGYGPPGGAPPGYGPPGQQPPPPGGGHGGGFSPPGGGPPGWGAPPPGGGGGYPNVYAPPAGVASVAGAWSPTEAIGFGWNALTKNFAGVALPIAVAIVVSILPGQAITVVYAAMAAVVADLVDPDFIGILGYLVQATSSLVGLFVGSFMAGGIASFTLKVARGQPVGFGEVFSGGRYFGRMLIATIGLYVAVLIGLVLCIIPGYIVALGLSLYSYVVVDQGLPGIDALKKSWEMTKGHKLNIFVYGLLAILVVLAGLLACGIGVLLGSYPVLAVGFAYVYLKIKGEQPQLAA